MRYIVGVVEITNLIRDRGRYGAVS